MTFEKNNKEEDNLYVAIGAKVSYFVPSYPPPLTLVLGERE